MLLEDAETLEKLFNVIRPNIGNIRNTAGPIMRRWFGEEDIRQVQKMLRPNLLRVRYWTNSTELKNLKKGYYNIWIGNFSFNDISMSWMAFSSEKARKRILPEVGSQKVCEPMGAFLRQPVCHILGETFTRKDVVKFHANNLGGAHYDPHGVENTPEKKRLRDTVGYEVDVLGNIKMLLGSEIVEAKKDRDRRAGIYDLADLILLDSAKRFAVSVLSERERLHALIA